MLVDGMMSIFYRLILISLSYIGFVSFSFIELADGLQNFIALLQGVSFIVPLRAVGGSVFVWLAFYTLKFSVGLANWIISKIPTIS